jgi:transposase-like protein
MVCPYCQFPESTTLTKLTLLGYLRYKCNSCHRTFNERTGTVFNFLEFPTDIVFQVLIWRFRYKLSLRDLAEMFLIRGFQFTHEAVREWQERFGNLLAEYLRGKRRHKAGRHWHVDETYIKVGGKWAYLYRAMDEDGQLVDALLSESRDLEAAQKFLQSAKSVVGHKPSQVTTDGHVAYRRAIQETLGKRVQHTVSAGLNSKMEQDHRGIKQRYYPQLGFKAMEAARRFCRAFEEVRNYFRARSVMNEMVSLLERRQRFIGRFLKLQDRICGV